MAASITMPDLAGALMAARSNSSSSFAQQGQVSWTDLGKTVVQASVQVLQRYSAAGIDPYTICVGQFIAGSFQFGTKGRKNFEQAIMKLPSMRSMGDIIHFGFGVDSVVRNLSSTEEGSILVAICAAVAECYPEDHAANILWELVRCDRPPESFIPSAMQWLALVRACAGSFSLSSFPNHAEFFMALSRYHSKLDDEYDNRRNCSSADTIAQALLGLGHVSTGRLESIVIRGLTDAGWLAAVAVWVFDLRIVIHLPDGNLLYENTAQTDYIQVYFIIGEGPVNELSEALTVKAKIYHLRDYTDVINARSGSAGDIRVCGRISWTNALSDAFGWSFMGLLDAKPAFAMALGCAARIYEAINNTEPEVRHLSVERPFSSFSSGFGAGFVRFITQTFPELKVLRANLDAAASHSTSNALMLYNASIANIASECGCITCAASSNDKVVKRRDCLIITLEAIIMIARALSGMSVAKGLQPLLSGFQAFQKLQIEKHAQKDNDKPTKEDLLRNIKFILDRDLWRGGRIEIGESFRVSGLADGVKLFSRGRSERNTYQKASGFSAVTMGGITLFLDSLVEISDDPERVGLCHVIPGRISTTTKAYSYLEDLGDFSPEADDFRQVHNVPLENQPKNLSSLRNGYYNSKLVVLESMDFLRVGYEVSGPGLPKTIIGPTQYTYEYLRASGLVKCNCRLAHDRGNGNHSAPTISQLKGKGPTDYWHFKGNSLSRIAALMHYRGFTVDKNARSIIQIDECLKCCQAGADLLNVEQVLILSKN